MRPEAGPYPVQRIAGPERPVDLVISTLLVLVLVVTTMSVQTDGLPRGFGLGTDPAWNPGQPPAPSLRRCLQCRHELESRSHQ